MWNSFSQAFTATALRNMLNAARTVALRTALRWATYDDGYDYKIHPAETAAGLTDADLTYGVHVGDVRRYGASTAAADNSAAITDALSVSANGGPEAYLPGGTWKHTATITIPASASLRGTGNQSILAPQGAIDALTFAAGTAYGGSQFLRDFVVLGPDATSSTNNAIVCNFTAASGSKVTGYKFSNLTIKNFSVGFFCRGLWNSKFEACFLDNNYFGYYFHGQSVVNVISGGFTQRGTITSASNSILGALTASTDAGVIADSIAGETTQSLHLRNHGIYAYSYNVSLDLSLYTSIASCDLSNYVINGIQLTTVQGGTIIRDCWIQSAVSAADPVGINISDIGTHLVDRIAIDACKFTGNTSVLQAGAIGVYIGQANDGVSVRDCQIGTAAGPFAYGVKNNGALNSVIEHNNIYSAAPSASYDVYLNSGATNCTVRDNVSQNAGTSVPLAFSGVTPPGLSYYGRGTFTLTLSGMSAATQGAVNYVANGRTVTLEIAQAGISGTSNATTMTGTGLPQYLWPATDQSFAVNAIDNDLAVPALAKATLAAASGVMTFEKDFANGAWTAANVKGLNGYASTYPYV